jgi:hypothetical protein
MEYSSRGRGKKRRINSTGRCQSMWKEGLDGLTNK